MAELTRQSSRACFMIDLLTNQVGFPRSVAEKYGPELVAEGFDTEAIFLGMSPEELRDDFEWKKGHVRKFELYLAERAALAPTAQSGGGSAHDTSETAAPVGSQLPGGSTLTLTGKIIGRGASGIVREAILTRRSGGTETVAAKMLGTGASEREMQKFAKEYDLSVAAAQQCSGTCRIYGCVRVEGSLCLVMKRYTGDLAQKLDGRRDASNKREALPLREAHAYLLQIAQSLVELHAMGVVCADLKPSNLLEDETGRLVVADFGIALLAEATITSTASHTGNGGGTVSYMAPEQHDSEQFGKVTPKADIWAWACIAVEMLSGAAPWSDKRALEISVFVTVKKHTPTIPPGVPDWLSALMLRSFSHGAAQRPTASELVAHLAANVDDLLAPEASDPDRGLSLATRDPGTVVYMHADALMQSSWTKREHYEFLRLTEVQEVDNPALLRRYEQYKLQIAPSDTPRAANEQLVFHGCAEDAIPAILERGFLKSFWKSAAGSWQRFGPGFYFALQASKSHEYPLGLMRALQPGEHSRKMLLCKVAKGNVLQTCENMDSLSGAAPAGYHSVHGIAEADGPLNFDELVVFDECAVLPYAIVTYRFIKKRADARSDSQELSLQPEPEDGRAKALDPSLWAPSEPELPDVSPFDFLAPAPPAPQAESAAVARTASGFDFLSATQPEPRAAAASPGLDFLSASPPEPQAESAAVARTASGFDFLSATQPEPRAAAASPGLDFLSASPPEPQAESAAVARTASGFDFLSATQPEPRAAAASPGLDFLFAPPPEPQAESAAVARTASGFDFLSATQPEPRAAAASPGLDFLSASPPEPQAESAAVARTASGFDFLCAAQPELVTRAAAASPGPDFLSTAHLELESRPVAASSGFDFLPAAQPVHEPAGQVVSGLKLQAPTRTVTDLTELRSPLPPQRQRQRPRRSRSHSVLCTQTATPSPRVDPLRNSLQPSKAPKLPELKGPVECKIGGKGKFEPYVLNLQSGEVSFEFVVDGGATAAGLTSTAKKARRGNVFGCKVSKVKKATARKPGRFRLELAESDNMECKIYDFQADEEQKWVDCFSTYSQLNDKGVGGVFLRLSKATAADRASPQDEMVRLYRECIMHTDEAVLPATLQELRYALVAFGVFHSDYVVDDAIDPLTREVSKTLQAEQITVRLRSLDVLKFLLTPDPDPQQQCNALIQCCHDLRRQIYDCVAWKGCGEGPLQKARQRAEEVLTLLQDDSRCIAMPYCTASKHMGHCPCVKR